MKKIALPQKPRYIKGDKFEAVFVVKGCYPGYGNTLGNALRRTLLSSLPGYAATQVKFTGVDHEFTTIPGVKENLIQVILNVKNLRFTAHKEGPIKLKLKAKGDKEVKGSDITAPSSIEIVNPETPIATLTDSKAKLEMDITVQKGIGYSPAEERGDKEKEIGAIVIDALFTPIRRVNYEVRNMRVGKRTDFDKVTFTIETDGSIEPEEAFKESAKILVRQFSVLAQADELEIVTEVNKELTQREEREEKRIMKAKKDESGIKIVEHEDVNERLDMGLEVKELGLPKRITNILEENKVNNLADIKGKTEEELNVFEGMGEKGLKEIKKAIGTYGLVLKS